MEQRKFDIGQCKPIEGYNNKYIASKSGDIISLYREIKGHRFENVIFLKTFMRNGYKHVSLSINSKVSKFKVHRIIAFLFVPNPENKPCVNHINGNKLDNRAENLEWCTKKENNIHALKNGLRIPARHTNASPITIYRNGIEGKTYVSIKEMCRNEKISSVTVWRNINKKNKNRNDITFKIHKKNTT